MSDLTFQPDELRGSKGVQSTLPKELFRKGKKAVTKAAHGCCDEVVDEDDELQDFKENSRNEELADYSITTGHQKTVHQIQKEIQQKFKPQQSNRKKKRPDAATAAAEAAAVKKAQLETLRKQTCRFKSTVPKFKDPCYTIINRPVSLNEGGYRVNFEPVDPKPKYPHLHKFENNNARTRFHHVAPCVIDGCECTYHTRVRARKEAAQNFNSVIQVEESFFEDRGLDNRFRPTDVQYSKIQAAMADAKKNSPSRRQSCGQGLKDSVDGDKSQQMNQSNVNETEREAKNAERAQGSAGKGADEPASPVKMADGPSGGQADSPKSPKKNQLKSTTGKNSPGRPQTTADGAFNITLKNTMKRRHMRGDSVLSGSVGARTSTAAATAQPFSPGPGDSRGDGAFDGLTNMDSPKRSAQNGRLDGAAAAGSNPMAH